MGGKSDFPPEGRYRPGNDAAITPSDGPSESSRAASRGSTRARLGTIIQP
jgi:hypothetical protein